MLRKHILLTFFSLSSASLAIGCVSTTVPVTDLAEGSDCEDKAEEMKTGCDSGRDCNYAMLKGHCSENPTTTTAVLDCLDRGNGCHTAFDPGNDDVKGCLDEVLSEKSSNDIESIAEDAATLCGADHYDTYGIRVFSITGTSTQIGALASCVKDATSCEGAVACLSEKDFGLGEDASCN